jgi:PKD repeat protein
MRIRLFLAAALIAIAILPVGTASADHGQPGFDPSKLEYAPIGFFKPGDPVPPNAPLEPTSGRKYNPSGKYNAFDTNFFETVTWPFRGADDKTDNDAPGSGDPAQRHGYCAPNPAPRPSPEAVWSPLAGECPNHQLEFIAYYQETMRDILGKYGVTFRNYEFFNPGTSNTLSGRAINPAAIVPGADHPDEQIVIGAHYDKTTDGPASTWDSQEGHAQMIRVAKLMADYWDATGTRPSATVKFIPWDGEESGTFGSLDYAQNNVVPSEEGKVRAYFNTDPCAGGYPAYRFGNPLDRVELGIQIADEEAVTEYPTERITRFNETAPGWVEQVFDRLDDTLALDAGDQDIFISSGEGGGPGQGDIGTDENPRNANVGKARPVLFSSDWRNFEALGIPFFNPGPEVTGPDSENNPHTADALAILHTPNDNQNTMNAYAGAGPSQLNGQTFAEGWIKGMEMCAHLLAHGMLQPEMGGGQTRNGDVVAYYEALPNEALQNQQVNFDARGSYQYANAQTHELVPEDQLEYTWDFGDGTTGTGREVKHGYPDIGVYRTKLTVRNRVTGQSDTMEVPVTVIGSMFEAPVLDKPAPEDEDGTFPLSWTFDKATREGFERFQIEEAPDYQVAFSEDAEAPIEERWNVETPTNAAIQPWQRSDSSTQKVRGNQAHDGNTSYWTGFRPQDIRPAGEVQQGESVMTLKQRFRVPKGSATLSFWSIYQMEGDDRGFVEIASEEAPDTFDEVAALFPTQTALGQQDPKTCDPSNPDTYQQPFEFHNVDIGQYAGKEITIRLKLVSGAENRALSQPCGWYVDDLRVAGGSFRPIGESLEEKFEVRDRAKGTYAYRVRGIYNDGVQTSASNVELVNVTQGVTAAQVQAAAAEQAARGCEPSAGFEQVAVRRLQQGRRLRFDFARRVLSPVRIDVFQVSRGRNVLRGKLVQRFPAGARPARWNGADRSGRQVRDGYFFVRFRIRQADGRIDIRRITLRRRNGRFFVVKPFYGRVGCALLASAKLRSPVFGGRQRRALRIAFIVTRPSRVTVTVLRGRKTAYRFRTRLRPAEVTHRLARKARRLRRRGQYRVRIVARSGSQVERVTLYARRL